MIATTSGKVTTSCISATVVSESEIPLSLKKISPATPMISQGTTSTEPWSPASAPRPANRSRVRPQAASVPRTSEPAVTTAATTSELTIASRASVVAHASSYQRVVKPSQGSEMIEESLNENSASISTGPNMISIAKATTATLAIARQAPANAGAEAAPVHERRPGRGRRARRRGRGRFAHPAATSCQARS